MDQLGQESSTLVDVDSHMLNTSNISMSSAIQTSDNGDTMHHANTKVQGDLTKHNESNSSKTETNSITQQYYSSKGKSIANHKHPHDSCATGVDKHQSKTDGSHDDKYGRMVNLVQDALNLIGPDALNSVTGKVQEQQQKLLSLQYSTYSEQQALDQIRRSMQKEEEHLLKVTDQVEELKTQAGELKTQIQTSQINKKWHQQEEREAYYKYQAEAKKEKERQQVKMEMLQKDNDKLKNEIQVHEATLARLQSQIAGATTTLCNINTISAEQFQQKYAQIQLEMNANNPDK